MVSDGDYAVMLTVLCLINIVQKAIQTHWLITVRGGLTSLLTKFVVEQPIDLLWTVSSSYDLITSVVDIIHFVPLLANSCDTVPSAVADENNAAEC